MTILILHQFPLAPFPYPTWLRESGRDLVLLGSRHRIEYAGESVPTRVPGYRHVEFLGTGDSSTRADRAVALTESFGVTGVVALHEADLQLAAELRLALDAPGMLPADVWPFRDKLEMKRRAAAAGIEVAAHAVVTTADDVRRFAALHGLPLVIKDRSGYSSIGLHILRTRYELEGYLTGQLPDGVRADEDVLMESFVPGRMCHVDGLVVNGHVALSWPSQYQYSLASFAEDRAPRIDVTLDREDPLTERLQRFTDQLLGALGPADASYAFHVEVFLTEDDRLVLCEVACRPGGARVRDIQQLLFGVNTAEYATRLQAGLPVAGLAGPELPQPKGMAGQVVLMRRPGVVRQVPEAPRQGWVRAFDVVARPGQVLGPPTYSSDFVMSAVVSAPDRATCERRLRALGEQFAAGLRMTPLPGQRLEASG
ncbi:MAG: hypothetical protein WCG47_06085 [Dermatophilaceae bacterium]